MTNSFFNEIVGRWRGEEKMWIDPNVDEPVQAAATIDRQTTRRAVVMSIFSQDSVELRRDFSVSGQILKDQRGLSTNKRLTPPFAPARFTEFAVLVQTCSGPRPDTFPVRPEQLFLRRRPYESPGSRPPLPQHAVRASANCAESRAALGHSCAEIAHSHSLARRKAARHLVLSPATFPVAHNSTSPAARSSLARSSAWAAMSPTSRPRRKHCWWRATTGA